MIVKYLSRLGIGIGNGNALNKQSEVVVNLFHYLNSSSATKRWFFSDDANHYDAMICRESVVVVKTCGQFSQ